MKAKIKWGMTAMALLVLILFSILAPRLADAWMDQSTIGKLSYETVSYEPYQPTYYSTFEEKLATIAAFSDSDALPYTVSLTEGEDAPDDAALLAAANEELEKMYRNGILPEAISLDTLSNRIFLEVYALPQDEDTTTVADFYFWKLVAPVGDGHIIFCMDCSFYKIYYLIYQSDYTDEITPMQEWGETIAKDNGTKLAEGWCRYWELSDAELSEYSFSYETSDHEIIDAYAVAPAVMCQFYLNFSNQHKLTVYYDHAEYLPQGKAKEWYLASGLLEMKQY